MKTTKIKIKNMFGISEMELDGKSIEIAGKKGTGKTSVIDAIKYALTNSSERDYIIRQGASEGEILVETDTGLRINRKKRTNQADYKSIKENGKDISSPESFLSQIFSPLQLDPVAFTQMSKQEQSRIILDLIEFAWDLNWIQEQFGEIPQGVDYSQHILKVLADIQAESGFYYQTRQDINREAYFKRQAVEDISKDIPTGYQAEKWAGYNLSEKYKELNTIRENNNVIQRAKTFKESYEGKIRSYEAEREIAIAAEEKAIANEREGLLKNIERMKAEIKAAEEKLAGLDSKLEDKRKIADSEYREKVAKLDTDIQVANEWADKEIKDVSELAAEIENAEAMKLHLNEYQRMAEMQTEIENLTATSKELTRKIELARNLPGEILKTAIIPVEGLTVENGIPLVNGLPVSNLSDGEKLDLCVSVAISKKNSLQMILLDGVERLDDKSRKELYAKCKAKGLQFVAARTTNDDELVVTAL